MTNFIPIFPLNLVVYPDEKLNLHIFEPRYKQLISECIEQRKPFGLPVVLDNKISEMGTLLRVVELSKLYDNGEMDIRTEGIMRFKIIEIIKSVPDKLYQGAIVSYPNTTRQGKKELMEGILKDVKKVHEYLNVKKEFDKPPHELISFDVAHHIGLSLEDEYYLLQMNHEVQRQEFLRRHLAKVIPVLHEMNVLKGKIKLNGHFKNLKGFNL